MNYTCITRGQDKLLPAPDAARPRTGERLIELVPNQAASVPQPVTTQLGRSESDGCPANR